MSFDGILAQNGAVRTLRRAVDEGRIASAYLFVGPGGVGKEMSAIALARAVIAGSSQEIARRINDGVHPDVRVFRPRDEGNRNIPVDFLRNEILPIAQFAPFEGPHAFLIFPEADVSFPEQHPEGANAILKTLEEPRPGVHFVLLAERPDHLLATIRSRCQRVRFRRLPDAVLDRVLTERGVKEATRSAAIALAGGRADRAVELSDEETASELVGKALSIDKAVDLAKPGTLVDMAEDLARSDTLRLTLETLSMFYRDVAFVTLGLDESMLAFRHEADSVRARAQNLDARRASARVRLLDEVVDRLDKNANPELTIDDLLFQLKDAS